MGKMLKSRQTHECIKWGVCASILVAICIWLALRWKRTTSYRETMEARDDVAKHTEPISLDEDPNFATINPFPNGYSSGARGVETYVNGNTMSMSRVNPTSSGEDNGKDDSSVLVGCGSCGTAAKWGP